MQHGGMRHQNIGQVARWATTTLRATPTARRHRCTADGGPLATAAADTAAEDAPPEEPAPKARKVDPRGEAAPPPEPLTAEHLQRNAALVDRLRGKLVLAPLTRGGSLPFRQLVSEFGAEVTVSEMAFARMLMKGEAKERAMLRRAPNEQCYGEAGLPACLPGLPA